MKQSLSIGYFIDKQSNMHVQDQKLKSPPPMLFRCNSRRKLTPTSWYGFSTGSNSDSSLVHAASTSSCSQIPLDQDTSYSSPINYIETDKQVNLSNNLASGWILASIAWPHCAAHIPTSYGNKCKTYIKPQRVSMTCLSLYELLDR